MSSDWLNYHHLLYFWTVAREGSIAKASKELDLAQPTISGQIHVLEEALGAKLLERSGRGLVLTETGHLIYQYADEIFSLGRELVDAVKKQNQDKPKRIMVGIVDVLPRLIAYQLLSPALSMGTGTTLTCREGSHERLLSMLALHEIDVILSEIPMHPQNKVRAFSHYLGDSSITFLASSSLLKADPDLSSLQTYTYNNTDTSSLKSMLDQKPFLFPSEHTQLRRDLDHWFAQHHIEPRIMGTFDDSTLMKTFGQAGLGLFAVPSSIAPDVCQQFGVQALLEVSDLRMRFYALTADRTISHPLVAKLKTDALKRFGQAFLDEDKLEKLEKLEKLSRGHR